MTVINSYSNNIRTGFHWYICGNLKHVFNCLLSFAFFGFNKTVFSCHNLAHLFLQSTGKNKKAKSFPFKLGVLSALFCASHSVRSKAPKPAAAWHYYNKFY